MFYIKNIVSATNIYRKLLVNNAIVINSVTKHVQYCGSSVLHRKLLTRKNTVRNGYSIAYLPLLHRKWYSKGLLDGDTSGFNIQQNDKVTKKITELFPEPRVTLNILNSKTPSTAFEIHYKQNSVAPKGNKKKKVPLDWTCTYAFVWPEKMKFESTAISKRLAAEKAATQAIQWLYLSKRIDARGLPIYDRNVLDNIKKTLNEPVHISISEKSIERVEKLWSDYESGINDIYEATFKEAKHKIVQTNAAVTKDSTIEDEDDLSEDEEIGDTIFNTSESKQPLHPVYGKSLPKPTKTALDRRERILTQRIQHYNDTMSPPLPIDEYRDLITSTVDKSRVTLIVGAAGCGKSTRAPAAILRHCGINTALIVSEPRRVAAIDLAQRVAFEFGEEVGESVGYQIRLTSKPPKPPAGSILFCTSGVLLRRLQNNPGLLGCTHVIIDEAHERDVNTDITLLLLRKALEINPELKIIVMSATLDIDVFTKYFDACPVIKVPGRTYPVEVSYIDDIRKKLGVSLKNSLDNCLKEDGKPLVNCYEVVNLIKAVDKKEKEGAILVFLPGWSEIKLTKQLLDEEYGASGLHVILPVHSRLSTADQTKMFATPPPGIRKIVLATNVAETSITIPDVVHVIDTGAHKENRIREGTGTSSLETVWVSLAGAKQRAGRAGRVKPGHCYKMYTKEKESDFAMHTTPEILRIPLEQTVLDCKSYAPNESIVSFLSQLPEPPSNEAIQFAVRDLIDLGALTPEEHLTRVGSLLSSLGVPPGVGRSVLHSAVVGNVLGVGNMATHCASNTELFVNAPERRDEIREIKSKYSSTSDHAALYGIQHDFESSWQEAGRSGSDAFCDRHGLRGDRLALIRSLTTLHLEQLLKTGMIPPSTEADELNRFSDIEELLSGVLLSGSDSLLVTRRRVSTKGKMATVVDVKTSTGDRAHIGSESVNHKLTKRSNKSHLLTYFGGHHSSERRALVVYKTSVVSPHTAILFCRGDIEYNTEADTTVLTLPKHRLNFHIPSSQVLPLLKAREMLWNTINYHLERDIKTLDFDDNTEVSRFKVRLIKAVGRILVEAQREHVEGKDSIVDIENVE